MALGGTDYSYVFLKLVIVHGISIFNLCLGGDISCYGCLHSSLRLLPKNLISSTLKVMSAANVVKSAISVTSGCLRESLFDANSNFQKF